MKLRPLPSARRAMREQEEASTPPTPPIPSSSSVIPASDTLGAASDVRGLIDNATSDRLFGWAWDAAHPGRRLKVELRLAGEVVANTIADFARPDLSKNGVGDGCHAFEFPLIADWVERRAELTAIAFGADGSEFPIAVRIRRPDDSQVSTHLQRMVDGVLDEQQQIRRELADFREKAAQLPEAAAVDAIAQAGHELQQRLGSLELWIARLDGKLGEITLPGEGRSASGLDPWQAVLLAVLASAVSAALALAAAKYLV
jgi:hypothetical protein